MAHVNDFDSIGTDPEENLVSMSPNHSHSDLGIVRFRRRMRVSTDEFGRFPDGTEYVLCSEWAFVDQIPVYFFDVSLRAPAEANSHTNGIR